MDDIQREAVAQESPTSTDETPGITTTAISQVRLLANPRRVRRA